MPLNSTMQRWLQNYQPQGTVRTPIPQPTVARTPQPMPTVAPTPVRSGASVLDPWALRATGQMPTMQPGVARRVQEWSQQQAGQQQMERQLQMMAPGIPKQDLWTMYRRQLGLEPGLQEPMSEYQREMLALERIQEARLREDMEASLAYQQAALAQSAQAAAATRAFQWAQLQAQQQADAAQLAQRKREMGAGIGQTIAGLQAQTWAQGMPYTLPKGTMFAPGFEPGGAASALARMGGARYTPQVLAPSPAPSRAEMAQWIEDAIAQFSQ